MTFTALVAPYQGGTPTGSVTFKDSSSVLMTVRLSGGRASFTTSRLGKGRHMIEADYTGSTTDRSSSATLVQQVK